MAAVALDLLLGQFHRVSVLFDDVQLDRIDNAALGAKSLDGAFDFCGLSRQLDVDPTGRFANVGAPHVRDDIVFPADLVNDRLLDLVLGKTDVEAEVCHHRPPAIAGTIDTSSPAFSDVSFPFKKRISSSLT